MQKCRNGGMLCSRIFSLGRNRWCETLIPGMEMVATPSHDGIMVSREASILLSPCRKKNAAFGRAGILFEEGCG